MKILDVCLLISFARLISATRHVLAGRNLDSPVASVRPVSPVATIHVAVGIRGSTLFQPDRVRASPGDHLVFDCYEDNLWLVKAAVDLPKVDNMPAILICQKNSTIHVEVLDTAPHLYYSPNIPPPQRFEPNMILALNGPLPSSTAPALATSGRQKSVSVTVSTFPPFPSASGATGIGQATGTGRPFSSGLSNPTPRTTSQSISPTTRVPVAPASAPSLTSGATEHGGEQARALQACAILSLGFVTMMLLV